MDFANRRRARRAAVQGLYQCVLTSGSSHHQIDLAYVSANSTAPLDKDYFHQLVSGVSKEKDRIDAQLQQFCHRKVEEIDPVERVILRVACYELMESFEVPYKVVIDEAVQLSKTFGAEQSYRFVNGILDKLAKSVRAIEQQSHD